MNLHTNSSQTLAAVVFIASVLFLSGINIILPTLAPREIIHGMRILFVSGFVELFTLVNYG